METNKNRVVVTVLGNKYFRYQPNDFAGILYYDYDCGFDRSYSQLQ